MYNYPSRLERRRQKFYSAAEKGLKQISGQILYPSEIKKLERDGFEIVDKKLFDKKRKLYSCVVLWKDAYKDGIPHAVIDFIYDFIETYPKNFVNSFSQELFITAERVNARKH